ncbi:MAG: hypothetical protein HY548_00750 [Elusimicrobia bacterium]|nr:hypothetical protein [Elusimicrobiota bacterium]
MPIAVNNLLGLVIFSLGILGIIISFLITDRKKYVFALVLSGVVIATGAYQYLSISIRHWNASRRIAKLQDQQRMNLQALQERLRQTQSQTQTPAAPAPKQPEAAKK